MNLLEIIVHCILFTSLSAVVIAFVILLILSLSCFVIKSIFV